MLQFILGKSGTGKTSYIHTRISELIENGESNIIMLIPDQSSFETEKSFLNLLGARKAKNVKVFGFSKLCSYVFEQTGNIAQNVIDNGTRSVIMNLALEQLSEKLVLFNSKNSKSVSEVMLQTLTECKKNAVTTNMLRASAEKVGDNTLKTKLYESSLILDTFDALLSQSYIDPLDDLTRLHNILLENNIFQNYTLFVDSFSGFTAQQLMVLRLLLNRCKASYISLTLNPITMGNDEVFETSYKTMRTITNLANKDNIQIKAPVKLTEVKRFLSDELSILESGVFRSDSEIINLIPENIRIYTAIDLYNECEHIAKQIKKLVIEEGYLYSEISVITHDTELYNGILNVVFDKYEIPYFMDIKKDVEVKPVIRFINSLFRIILNDFEREDIVSLLKTGLTINSDEDINLFENYTYIWNINTSKFKSEFINNPRGFSEEFSDNDKLQLAKIEAVRLSVVEPILKFKADCKDKNGRQITQLLYELMHSMGLQTALDNMCEALNELDDDGTEQIRIYNLLIDVLDKMVAVVGETPLNLKRYFELLSIQISSIQLAEIPQTLDSVTVTSAQRVRLSTQKVSFLIGCVDGQFPAVPHTTGVFSQFELKILSLNDISISDDFVDLNNLETFMAYSCMTSASQKLYFSFPIADGQGNQLLHSKIIDEVYRIFPKVVIEDNFDIDTPENAMWAIQPAFEEYAKSLGRRSDNLRSLEDIFKADERYSSKLDALKRATDNSEFVIENPENTHLLFGDNMRISASQIEKFNLCRFSYFCNYGLRVRERLKAEINPMEYGTLVHFVLETFFTSYSKDLYCAMNFEEINELVTRIVSDYVASYMGDDEKSASFLFRLKVIIENISKILLHIIEELSQSDFDVADCELKIGSDIPAYTIKLPTGENIAVCGSIDRVDIMEINGTKYLRVVDYKTGIKKFKLSDILYGLNLQMLLYLNSVKQNGDEKYGEVTPAGILYMPATFPVLTNVEPTDTEKIKKKLDSELKMNGLILNKIEVVRGMDKSSSGRYIPVKVKADLPVSDNSLATLEQFGKIFNKLDLIIAEMGRELYNGRIEASATKGAHDACEYCPYDSVCTYHMSEPKNTFEVKNDEVYKAIDKEINGGEE